MVRAKITLPTHGLKKYHLTHLWYVSVNLRNPPQAQPLQKHLLTPKHNITRIKIPKTQKLFKRETCGEINVFFVVFISLFHHHSPANPYSLSVSWGFLADPFRIPPEFPQTQFRLVGFVLVLRAILTLTRWVLAMEPSLRIWAVLKCDLGNWVLIIF